MSEWIECNLQWDYSEYPDYKRKSDMYNWQERMNKELGYDLKSIVNDYMPWCNSCNIPTHSIRDIKPYIMNVLNLPMTEEIPKQVARDFYDMEKMDFFIKYSILEKKVKMDNEYSTLKKNCEEWLNKQEDWIAEKKEYEEYFKEHKEKVKQKSFCGRELNKAGTLIEIEDIYKNETRIRTLFIGDININGCSNYCYDDYEDEDLIFDKAIVKRYKIIWEGEN